MAELVSIARFTSPIPAQLARARLELAGIPAVLQGEASGLLIDLRVLRAYADEALELLTSQPEAEPVPTEGGPEALEWGPDTEVERCLICQSSFVEVKEPSLPLRMLRGLLRTLLPLPDSLFRSRQRRCGVCGHQWREGSTDHPGQVPGL